MASRHKGKMPSPRLRILRINPLSDSTRRQRRFVLEGRIIKMRHDHLKRIQRIEAGPKGGRILFGAQPRIDPVHMIELIQTRPKEFKLDGGDKLRFIRDLADPQSRIDQVQRVLHALSGG